MTSLTHKTRILILSDTHGKSLPTANGSREAEKLLEERQPGGWFARAQPSQSHGTPLPVADVVLHCGDLTKHSTAVEFETTFAMLRAIDAPLKLVIPGNHDWDLQRGFWRSSSGSSGGSSNNKYVAGLEAAAAADIASADEAADEADIWDIIQRAGTDNVFLLPHGTHTFTLAPRRHRGESSSSPESSPVRLRVFASPLTPRFGSFGFQYPPSRYDWSDVSPAAAGSEGSSGTDLDVAMTHGPPLRVLDRAWAGSRAGCPALLAAVERARPRIHCFGHIHEAWGAGLATWARPGSGSGVGGGAERRPRSSRESPALPVVDYRSFGGQAVGGDADGADAGGGLLRRAAGRPKEKTPGGKEVGCACLVDVSARSVTPLDSGRQTLFVNASVMSVGYRLIQQPWLVDLDLQPATEADMQMAKETWTRLSQF